jgi:hypothetical protein
MFPVGLSFQQAPSFSVPFRFFITAPLFLLAAAMLLIFDDTSLMVTRHSPAALAATHLITLGFTTMVMCGALLQLLPVLSGIVLPHPVRIAWLIHAPLTLGAAGIASAFLWNLPWLMYLSMACLAASFCSLLLTLATSLWRAPTQGPSLSAMRLALVALAVTVCFGLILGMARHIPLSVPYQILADLHPLWGLYGWTTLLIMGMAYQLVPMFQFTPIYPAILTKRLVGVLLMCIAVRTLVAWIPAPVGDGLARLVDVSLAVGALLFAIVTLRLQWRRKRKVSDTTLNFWQIGMGALLLAGTIGFLLQMLIGTYSETLRMALGVLVLLGFAVAVINGMLYKIVPFLTWFHLQSAYPRSRVVPNVRQIQSGFHAHYQMVLYLVSLTVLTASCWVPSLSRIAGILWAINALWLELNLLKAARIFLMVQRVARTS